MLVEDADSEDVARKQVAGELNASKLAADGGSQSMSQCRLADAGHVFNEEVSAREECYERKLDGLRFALERRFDNLA